MSRPRPGSIIDGGISGRLGILTVPDAVIAFSMVPVGIVSAASPVRTSVLTPVLIAVLIPVLSAVLSAVRSHVLSAVAVLAAALTGRDPTVFSVPIPLVSGEAPPFATGPAILVLIELRLALVAAQTMAAPVGVIRLEMLLNPLQGFFTGAVEAAQHQLEELLQGSPALPLMFPFPTPTFFAGGRGEGRRHHEPQRPKNQDQALHGCPHLGVAEWKL
jgi:hypothetical protein